MVVQIRLNFLSGKKFATLRLQKNYFKSVKKHQKCIPRQTMQLTKKKVFLQHKTRIGKL
jgi:hypothetical protein